jgi:hypothetical protein
LHKQSDDSVNPSPLMGEGFTEGVTLAWVRKRKHENPAADNVIPIRRVLGHVTPTLTRPHPRGRERAADA